jgi:hypothetical protein
LDFTAIEVDHGGVEFRGRHTTHQCAGRFGRAVFGRRLFWRCGPKSASNSLGWEWTATSLLCLGGHWT